MTTRGLFGLLALSVLVLAAAPVAHAAENSPILRINALWIEPLSDTASSIEDVPVTISADSAFGAELDLEFLLTKRLGLEGAVAWASPDVSGESGGESAKAASTDLMPLVLTADLRWIGEEHSTCRRARLEFNREFTVLDHVFALYFNAECFYDARYDGWEKANSGCP